MSGEGGGPRGSLSAALPFALPPTLCLPATSIWGGPRVSFPLSPPSLASSAGSGPAWTREPTQRGLGVSGPSPPHFTGPRGGPEREAAGPQEWSTPRRPWGARGARCCPSRAGGTLRLQQFWCRAGSVLNVTLSSPGGETPPPNPGSQRRQPPPSFALPPPPGPSPGGIAQRGPNFILGKL